LTKSIARHNMGLIVTICNILLHYSGRNI